MMSLLEEREMRDKMTQAAQAGLSGAAVIGEPKQKERLVNEEEWGFITTLSDLIVRARWGVDTRRVTEILYDKAKELELEVSRAGPNG